MSTENTNKHYPRLIYCYDAYCGWCYGFSNVMQQINETFALAMDVLSGGMVIDETVHHISHMADYIKGSYKNVEQLAGVQFGEHYLWHIENPSESDWIINSEIPAIALCIIKDLQPENVWAFAKDMQLALFAEGRDLCDVHAYDLLLDKYGIEKTEFYEKMKQDAYKQKARYEFALVKQLGVTGYPTLLMQVSETKLYLLARGFTDFETVKERINQLANMPIG
jgi:putative protein-disulfide isomerase